MKKTLITSFVSLFVIFTACNQEKKEIEETMQSKKNHKEVVYQVFTRLFGNTNKLNKPWGTIEENGVGKFTDFSEKALQEIKDLGVTHIWYTGVFTSRYNYRLHSFWYF